MGVKKRKKMKNRLGKRVVLSMAFCGSLFVALDAATYTENYTPLKSSTNVQENDNKFMGGNFETIYRFDMIVIDDDEIEEASQKTVEDAVAKIHELEKNGKEFQIALLGHTEQANDDANEKRIESDSYASSLQNLFSKDFTSNESINLSQEYVKIVEKKLLDENITQEKISLEPRGAQDQIFTEIYEDDKENSHGVFLTIYVPKKEVKKVVEAKVVEPKVQRVEPKPPVKVKKETLSLKFELNSDKILQRSFGEVQRFATFLKNNSEYDVLIIGHTDSAGSDVLNMDLSQRRALMTKKALVEQGVESSRLSTKGRGELDPIESNLTAKGREANRRTEVELFLRQ